MKHLILAVMMIAMLAMVANAAALYPPPANGAYGPGWGMNPTDWQTTTGSFSSWGLYDPLGGGGGDPWVVEWLPSIVYIDYADITLELWIEMYSLQTYHYTSYQWHRRGDGGSPGNPEQIECIIEGTSQSNNGQSISLTRGTEDLTHLWFVEDIFGRVNGTTIYGTDIPISWSGRYGSGLTYGTNFLWPNTSGDWEPLTPGPDITIPNVPLCDHWFQFKGVFELIYHQEDGYYKLTMAGCPAPTL